MKLIKLTPFSGFIPFGKTVGLTCHTIEKYRRQGIHNQTRILALQYLKRQGFQKALDVEDSNNIAIRESLLKLGYYQYWVGHQLRLLKSFEFQWIKLDSESVEITGTVDLANSAIVTTQP